MTPDSSLPPSAPRTKLEWVALRTSALYWIAAAAWILLSDAALVALVSDHATVDALQTYKGWAFVTVTAVLFYIALRGQLRDSYEESAARRQAELTLLESEERYRATFDRAPIGIAHVGLDGRWLRVNDAACALTGYSREELAKLTFSDITHPDDLAPNWGRAARALAGEVDSYEMEKRYVRKDGSIVGAHPLQPEGQAGQQVLQGQAAAVGQGQVHPAQAVVAAPGAQVLHAPAQAQPGAQAGLRAPVAGVTRVLLALQALLDDLAGHAQAEE